MWLIAGIDNTKRKILIFLKSKSFFRNRKEGCIFNYQRSGQEDTLTDIEMTKHF